MKPTSTLGLRTPESVLGLLKSEQLLLIADEFGINNESDIWPGKVAGVIIGRFFERPFEERLQRYFSLIGSGYNPIYKRERRVALIAKLPKQTITIARQEKDQVVNFLAPALSGSLSGSPNKICVAALISELQSIGYVSFSQEIRTKS